MPANSIKTKDRSIGIALGSGSARGWAHIGVLQALTDAGIEPDIICGASLGALVGAVYANNNLRSFSGWARELDIIELVKYMDIKLVEGGGFVQGKRLMDFLKQHIGDMNIEKLPKAFATVAADLSSGREIWFRTGPLLDAVRASISLPGIFTPVRHDGQWLVDGGLVNPVPVSLCRAMGARVVIAVNLNGDIVGRHLRKKTSTSDKGKKVSTESRLLENLYSSLKKHAPSIKTNTKRSNEGAPGLFDVVASSINIMQDRITRSRMAGDPPDIILSPRLGHIGLLEVDRAAEAIEEGRKCVERMLPALKDILDRGDAGC
ncbi:MAG TPA: patatin-like phospholipase RssA [Nitrospirae bacterium]|nr:patatin-like phospholipase RssA [Nitrospirota bacterium]